MDDDARTPLLLVEDDDDVREATAMLLARHGFAVRAVPDGVAALAALEQAPAALIVLDVAMPRMDGITFLRRLRRTATTPVLLLTARDAPGDVVTGLEAGADDHVTKPWDADVLVARLRALERRAAPAVPGRTSRIGEVVVDRVARRIERAGEPVAISATEFRLLDALVDAAGAVLSRRQLLEAAWDEPEWVDERVVDTNVLRLRAKLGEGVVETVRGFGYRLGRG